jgi:pimeloyl-ACP methyl ester carboxylesterase
MQSGEEYASGLTLNFFDSSEFEDDQIGETTENIAKQTRNLLRVLMQGWNEGWHSLITRRTFNAVFVNRDHQMTQAMRLAFQQGFNHIFSQLDGRQLPPQQQNQALLFISNCLTFLPFADPTRYESFAIPQYVDGRWRFIDYNVVPIELTPTSGFKKLFINDSDRVFAYGLEPIHHAVAEPHLIFMGTTYPAGQGFATTINTDLEAFETAGKKLYRTGHHNISRWLDKQHPKKTHVCGTSLGGALSLLVAIDQGDKLSRVDALNPPGLYHPWHKSRFDHWDKLETKPEVYIQKQQGDPVSRFGEWKPDWHVLRVTPPAIKRGPNSVADHALNYAGFAETTFIGVDTLDDNKERKRRNLWMYTLLRSATYYFGMVPFRYLILPSVRFILAHKIELAITLPFIALCFIAPPLAAILMIAVGFAPLVYSIMSKIVGHIITLVGFNDSKLPKHLQPMHPRNQSMDIYQSNMEATFSYKEIGEYYETKRTLKGKPFLPDEQARPHKFFKSTALTKREVLEKSQDPEFQNTNITFVATKAKIHDIRQTLHLRHKYNHENDNLRQSELKQAHQDYITGTRL